MEPIDNVLCFGLLLATLLRWTVSQFHYSGYQKPPLYGDYEAQRHWMEVTVNIDAIQWYTNSSDNDLNYWGLDYPPLTAYHSYINGKIAEYIDKSWVELYTSRGFEGYYHKLFMRSTVLAVDLLIFYSAIVYFWSISWSSVKLRDKAIVSVLSLINPSFILIDYGHFQYNCVCLGLTLWSINFLMKERHALAAIAFSLALNYKQMTLYYAFPIFWYLLSRCVHKYNIKSFLIKFTTIAISVIITFIICWSPYIHNYETTLQVFRRLFPISRGIYEDKVANFWCSISILIKLKKYFADSTLALMSAITTLIVVMPSNIWLFKKPSIKTLILSMINSSLLFFLFSFQVHEKSILLVLMPVLLIMDKHPTAVLWFTIISAFSLQPLLLKDDLMIPFYSLIVFFCCAFFNAYNDLQLFKPILRREKIISICFISSIVGCLLLSLSSLIIKPPKNLPDIHAVLNSLYSCSHFILFSIYFHKLQYDTSSSMTPVEYHSALDTLNLTKLKKKRN